MGVEWWPSEPVFFTSDDPKQDWEKPSDFLVSYLKSKLGLEWLSDQFNKDYRSRHEVAKWYTKGIPNIEEGSSDIWQKPNGKALALLHLAYDLFVLEHEGNLPDFILERLRNGPNFNGARYELFVFATLIRAGFDIEYSDEKSGLNGRVPECKITHRKTKQQLYVEAKTRNIKNVLGSTQGKSKKIRLYGKLKDALDKDVDGPYLIFVDVNHPNIKAKRGKDDLEKIRSEYKKLEKIHANSLPNIVCFTNIPFHYGADDSSPEQSLFGFMLPRYPKYKLNDIDSIFEAINSSIGKYHFLPKEFNEADTHANTMLDNTKI
ncbi:MAG: hypothetical protein JKY60_04025 [Kordiimonadaceae bacterium]|nr:hypothetical protein [Kordiimonadaceae bacterium]